MRAFKTPHLYPDTFENPQTQNEEAKKFDLAIRALERGLSRDILCHPISECSECGNAYLQIFNQLTNGKCPDCYKELKWGVIPIPEEAKRS